MQTLNGKRVTRDCLNVVLIHTSVLLVAYASRPLLFYGTKVLDRDVNSNPISTTSCLLLLNSLFWLPKLSSY